uniref:Reverse transcriptase zinc-binding domain-containing protein n=1 Tax=Cannabis sativa TaxID=3483 RepID=A0A803Q8X7_CANSA
MNNGDSGLWKAILNTRSLLANCICRKIGNGKETSIWFYPWIPCSNRFPTPLLDATYGVAWVNQFMDENYRRNVDMFRRWFNSKDAKAILNIELPEDDIKDGWLWMGEASGEFSIKLTYRVVRGRRSITPAKNRWKTIWKS